MLTLRYVWNSDVGVCVEYRHLGTCGMQYQNKDLSLYHCTTYKPSAVHYHCTTYKPSAVLYHCTTYKPGAVLYHY